MTGFRPEDFKSPQLPTPRVDPETGCWIWQGKLSHGYGRVGAGGRGNGYVFAHRWAYAKAYGPVPDGHEVHHTCENTACVNPAHLEALTRLEHMRRDHRTKYTLEIARAIRADTTSTHVALAQRLGVDERTVGLIRRGERWKDAA